MDGRWRGMGTMGAKGTGEPNGQPDGQQSPFGRRLRELRVAAGLTQAELAERSGLAVRGLSDLERGVNRSPRRETLGALSEALGLTAEEQDAFASTARRRPRARRQAGGDAALPETQPTGAPTQAVVHTFLIVDIRGYTTFTFKHGDAAAAQLAMRFAQLAAEVVEQHGGRVLELRGDEALCVFASARGALLAAVDLQRCLAATSESGPLGAIPAGIGLDSGEALPVEGGYRGLALNLAARLCAQAAPGEVLASETVTNLARKVAGVTYLDRGVIPLKGFAAPVHVLQVVPEASASVATGTSATADESPTAGAYDLEFRQNLLTGGFLGSLPEGPLAARAVERARLDALVETVAQKHGRMVALMGEPGIGKTRLAQEVTLLAHERGFWIASGRCFEPQSSVAYYPFLEALSAVWNLTPEPLRAEVPRQWPEVVRLLPSQEALQSQASIATSIGGRDDQQRLFWQVSDFLRAVAEKRPLALFLDDVHWADGASIGLMQHLAQHLRDRPILLLITVRDAEVERGHPLAAMFLDLGRQQLVERVHLVPLPEEGARSLVALTLGIDAGEAPKDFVELLHQRTEGNPFFMYEILHALAERGHGVWLNGAWNPKILDDLKVPETVRAAVLQRIAHLGSTTQEMLREASILGQAFTFGDLVRMGDHEEGEVESALEEALAAVLIRETGPEDYSFSHALTQQALYEELHGRKRTRLHRAAAAAIERLSEQTRRRRAAEIAYHLEQAGERALALPYELLAGDQAREVFANAEAERCYRTALYAATELGETAFEADALERLGWLYLWGLGEVGRASEVLEPSLRSYRMVGDGVGEHRVGIQLARAYARCGRPEAGLELALSLLDRFPRDHLSAEQRVLRARSYSALADIYYHRSSYREQLAAAEQAIALWQEIGELRSLADAMTTHAMALRQLGRHEDGVVELERIVALADEAGVTFFTVHAWHHLAYAFEQSGQMEKAASAIAQAQNLAERLGVLHYKALIPFRWGLQAYYRGDWQAARESYDKARNLFKQAKPMTISAYGPLGEGQIRLVSGAVADGMSTLRETMELAQQTTFGLVLYRAVREMAEAELALGHGDAARVLLDPHVHDPVRREENDIIPLLPLAAWACLQIGDEVQAEALLKLAEPQARGQHHALALLDVLRIRGLLRAMQGCWDEAIGDLEESRTLARAMPFPYAEAKALYMLGQSHSARGDSELAREMYEQADAILDRLGEGLYLPLVRQALGKDQAKD